MRSANFRTARFHVASCRRRVHSPGASRVALRIALVLALAALCTALAACRGAVPVTSVEAPSSDGAWLAVAHTEPAGWFARKTLETTVSLRRVKGHTDPVDSLWEREPWLPVTVLRLTHPAPAPSGGALIEMHWLTPTHLEIGYRGKARIDYHLPNCSGVHILVTPLAAEESAPMH